MIHPAPPPPPTRWQLLGDLALPLITLALGVVIFARTVIH